MDKVRISPDDPIEKLIVKSVRLGEIAFRKRTATMTEDELDMVEEMEEESERLWKEAKRLGEPMVTRENWEGLAVAIVQRAVLDYEDLMCGTEHPGKLVNNEEVLGFLEDQTFIKFDMLDQIDHIKNTYYNKFVPYAAKHWKDIVLEWRDFSDRRKRLNDRIHLSRHRCPLCRGAMRPLRRRYNDGIGCTGCNLVYYLPFELKEVKLCRNSPTRTSTQESAKS